MVGRTATIHRTSGKFLASVAHGTAIGRASTGSGPQS